MLSAERPFEMVVAFEKTSECAGENDSTRAKKKKRKSEREGEDMAVNAKTLSNDEGVAESEKRKKTKINKSESCNVEQVDSGLRNALTACSENESKPGKICKTKKKKGKRLSSSCPDGEALSAVDPFAQSHEEHMNGLSLSRAENTANVQVVSNKNKAEKSTKNKKKKKSDLGGLDLLRTASESREKEVEESATILNCGETEVTHRKRKVKKNKKGKNCTTLQGDTDKKLLDMKDYQQDENSTSEGKERESGTCTDFEVSVPKKKRKKTVTGVVQVQKNDESFAYDVAIGTKVSGNAKKCKIAKGVENNPQDVMVDNDQIVENLPVTQLLPKKKKKGKKSKNLQTDISSNVENISEAPNNTVKGILDTKKVKKSRKKGKLCSYDTDRTNGETEPCADLSKKETVPKEKQKKDKTSGRSSQVRTENTTSIAASEVLPKKKKRKQDELSSQSSATEVLSKKKRTKKEKELSSASEVLPKKKTRKVEEVSHETEKKKNGESTDHLDQAVSTGNDNMGQWKTAKLGNSAQQGKFVRLLGGAKSAAKKDSMANDDGQSILSRLTGVWKPPPGRKLFRSKITKNKTFSSMALDEKEAEKLEANLENQYNRTLEFNLKKRKEGNAAKGLGFQEDPAKGKIHYIDINKVKSMALD